jgi:prephenate dehydrogenase
LAADDELVFELAAGSFRDSTRAATENLPMWSDIFATNPHGLSSALQALIQTLSQLAEQVKVADEASVQAFLQGTAEQWHKLFD